MIPADLAAAHAEGRREGLREAAAYFRDNVEIMAAGAHAAYQEEAHRRGDVRHPDAYDDLPEATKEWDRVLVRWVAGVIEELAKEGV